jgi:hypothetical protein
MQTHPELKHAPRQPKAGTFIISANNLVGVMTDPSDYAWLRENFKPIDHVAYSYLIFNVTPEDLLRIAEVFIKE